MWMKRREPVETVKVLMIKDAWGAPDGLTRTFYGAGQEYDLPVDLAGCFFSTGEADPAEAHMQDAEAAQEPLGEAVEPAAPSEGAKTRRAARGAKFGAGKGV